MIVEDYQYPADEFLLLGRITRAHGLRGEVKVFLHSGQPENIRSYGHLFLIDRHGELSGPWPVLRSRNQGKLAIVQLASLTCRDQAEAMEGRGVLLAKADLPEIPADEYYWHQYIGKEAVDVAGRILGKVEHIFRNGLQDVLVLRKLGSDEEILVPMTKEIIVGETAGKLIVDPPPGLLELNAGS